MTAHPFAELMEQIAERERKAAVREGDYGWALVCAIVEAASSQFTHDVGEWRSRSSSPVGPRARGVIQRRSEG